jgi:uncharacterized protein (DUF433 family)
MGHRFFADENFPQPAVERLRERGHDVLTVPESGYSGRAWPDEEVLRYAISTDRAVLTLNRRHFIRLHAQIPDHLGIVVCIRATVSVGAKKMDEPSLLKRITVNPKIFGGKPIIRGRRLAVEHILGMLAAGDSPETILSGYHWLEPEDVQACLVYARRLVAHERLEPLGKEPAA